MSSLFTTGKLSALSFLLIMWALALVYIYQAKKGVIYPLRRVAAVDGLKECVDRCAEMGRPVHYTPGDASITTATSTPQLVASMSILHYVAQMCARSSTRLIVSVCYADMIPLAEESVRSGYVVEGKLDAYVREDLLWFGNEQHSYSTGVQALMYREKIGANIMIGSQGAESSDLPEVAHKVGAMQVAGTGSGYTLANWLIACDYCFIGDEMFIVAAEITKDPKLMNNIRGQDILKCILIGIPVIGTVLVSLGYTIIRDLLNR